MIELLTLHVIHCVLVYAVRWNQSHHFRVWDPFRTNRRWCGGKWFWRRWFVCRWTRAIVICQSFLLTFITKIGQKREINNDSQEKMLFICKETVIHYCQVVCAVLCHSYLKMHQQPNVSYRIRSYFVLCVGFPNYSICVMPSKCLPKQSIIHEHKKWNGKKT